MGRCQWEIRENNTWDAEKGFFPDAILVNAGVFEHLAFFRPVNSSKTEAHSLLKHSYGLEVVLIVEPAIGHNVVQEGFEKSFQSQAESTRMSEDALNAEVLG